MMLKSSCPRTIFYSIADTYKLWQVREPLCAPVSSSVKWVQKYCLLHGAVGRINELVQIAKPNAGTE
jgi:hypothetical protein